MEGALMVGSMISAAVAMAVLVMWISAHAINPPDRIAKSWMQVLMFDPTPMGATLFDKDWPKCPK